MTVRSFAEAWLRGITQLPTFLVGPDIKAGRLQVVLPSYPATELGIYALYAPNRYLAAKTRVTLDKSL